jgi:hypothetical protein
MKHRQNLVTPEGSRRGLQGKSGAAPICAETVQKSKSLTLWKGFGRIADG